MNPSPQDRALQRYRAYSLLSRIFAEGATPTVIEIVQDLPILADALPAAYDADQAAAEYQELFGFNVLPYAGVYLSEDGKLGGAIHQELDEWYDSFGFEVSYVPGTPDHISAQLEFLAFTSFRELEAYNTSSQSLSPDTIRRLQAKFLQHQVTTWCFPFLISVKASGHPFYTEVVDITQAMIVSHYSEVAAEDASAPELPTSPDILQNQKTSLKDIAQFLCRPVYSGVYFTRRDIKQISNTLNIPSGFGDRVQLLTNAFRSAVTFEAVPALLENLKSHVLMFKAAYVALEDSGMEGSVAPWISKVEGSVELIANIRSQKS